MLEASESVAVLAGTVYSGAALYVTLVAHPARLACATEVAWAQWAQSVRRTPRYAALPLVTTAVGLLPGRLAAGSPWTWGSIVIFAVLPFTAAAILPMQQRLLELGPASTDTRPVLEKWGWRHAVRTGLGLIASTLFLWAAFGRAWRASRAA